MRFSSALALLAMASFQHVLAEDSAPGPEHCGSFVHPLTRSGSTAQIGEIVITDSLSPWREVAIDAALEIGYDLTADAADDSAPTWITEVQASVCCPDPTTVPCVETTIPYSPGVTSASFTMAEPDCGELPHDHEVLVDVHANIEKMGGTPAIETLFPVPVQYVLSNDDGGHVGASYFDIRFTGTSHLAGISFDGYCVDYGNGISTGIAYTGWAHSYADTAAFVGTNIEYPERMDQVAWAINAYRPGNTYTESIDGVTETYTMTSGTLQRAVWHIIGDDNGDGGGSWDEDWALHIKDQAPAHDGYVPPPGAFVPIVLLPDDGSSQHVIIEATCSQLRLPCDPITVTASADATAQCSPDPPPGMSGDPHLMSWSGEYFEYMGECDLVLLHVPNFGGGKDDLTVHVRTTIRYDYSYIEVAALRIGEDTLEVTSWGEYTFNDVEDASISSSNKKKTVTTTNIVSKMGDYPIYHNQVDDKNHRFDIVLPNNQNITISSMKDIVNVKINHASFEYFGTVQGVLGNHHGEMLARDGATDLSDDINQMGQEWQVRDDEPMLFTTNRAPRYPQKCNLPTTSSAAAKEKRRLGQGISEEKAKIACAHLKGQPRLFDNCVYDVTITNDLDQAGAY